MMSDLFSGHEPAATPERMIASAVARASATEASGAAGVSDSGTHGVGAAADLILVNARSWTELQSRPQADRTVLRAGRAIDTTPPDYRELDDLMR